MRIGEMAALTQTTPRLLRYYEEQGLITPTRGPNGYREYGPELEFKIGKIRCLLATGMPTRLIQLVLPCFTTEADVLEVTPEPGVRASLVEYRDRLDHSIERLAASRDAIDRYLAHVGGAAGSVAPLPEPVPAPDAAVSRAAPRLPRPASGAARGRRVAVSAA